MVDPFTGEPVEPPLKRQMTIRMWADMFLEWSIELKRSIVRCTPTAPAEGAAECLCPRYIACDTLMTQCVWE